jgi:hypothetical protein
MQASLASHPTRGADSFVLHSLKQPTATANVKPVSAPSSSSFASSIDAYVHNLEHELVPPPHAAAAVSLPAAIDAGVGGGKSVSSKIRELRMVKEQLEKELNSVAHGSLPASPARAPPREEAASAFAAAAAATAAQAAAADAAAAAARQRRRRRASAAELLRQKAALERRLAAYSKEQVGG